MSHLLRASGAPGRGLGRMYVIALAAAAVCLRLGAEDAPAQNADPSTLITTYAEYWKQGVRRASRPIRAEIVVSYFDPGWHHLWGEIDGQPGYMACRLTSPIGFRDRILIEGTVTPWRGLEPEQVTITVLERNVPLTPADLTGQVADFSRFKERLITCEAVLDQQRLSSKNHLEMDLITEGHRIRVFHWMEQPRLLDLAQGAIVRLTGLYNGAHDPRTESLEIDLWVARSSDIIAVGTLDNDPRFALPLTPIGDLPTVSPGRNRRARIAGRVREYTPGVSFTLRDETGQILVRSLQTLPLQVGDFVEATGDAFPWGTDWLLRNALVRRATAEATARMTSAPAQPATLRMLGQVLELSTEEAAEGKPVDVYGIIMWCSPAGDFMILRDPSGGVVVHLNGHTDPPPKRLLGVRIAGVTSAGPYAPEVQATRIDFWGGALLPEARPATLDQAMTGQYQGQRVEMRGYVKQAQADAQTSRLVLATATGEFTVRIDRAEALEHLIGSIVSVRGICQAVANVRRQLTGVEVWMHWAEHVRVEQTSPVDPFQIAERPIGALRQFDANASLHRWARIRGVVTQFLPGRLLCVQDGAEGLLILTAQTDPLSPGDMIEATGLPGVQNRRVVLREAVYQKLGHAGEPAAVDVTAPRTVVEELESRLVRVHGHLINSVREDETVDFAVQADNVVFTARAPRPPGAPPSDAWRPGSEVNVTGVYEIIRDERDQATGFRLQLRTLDDVTILATPSWWTPGRLLVVTGALLACIAGAGCWGAALRRRVQQQTAQIRTQLAKEAHLEAHNRDIVANASDVIFTTDLAGRFTSFNPAGERLTGFTRDAVLAMNARDLVSPDDAAQLTTHLDRLHHDDATVTFQSWFRRHDGSRVWVETSLRLRREGGQPSGMLGVVRDVSERKQVEEELRRARDAAEANTQAKSTFLANMSHEIRTPMNAVIGMSNLLLDTRLDEEQREFACTIRNGAESLLTVLNDILDFSRIEAGKLHFETLDFDLAETIDQTLELLAPRAASKRLELSAFLPPALPDKVRGDPGRLRQVLLNLLGNAVKFTEHGEVTLSVSLVQRAADTVTLMFEVRDTGVGLTPETLTKLFLPFSQADASMARRFGGAGLGLAISKQIVELLGGTIGAESEAGRGANFWFTVPLALQPAGAVAPGPELAVLGGVRVLAVDDHATNRRIARHHAQAWGMRCDVANDAATALAELRTAAAAGDPFHVLLSDCAMPGTDGLTLARSIQEDPALRGLPIVLLTSVDRRLSASESAALGIAVVLTKPMRVPDLAAALLRALGHAPALRAAAAPRDLRSATDAAVATLRVLVAEDNLTNQRLIALQLGKLGCIVAIANHGIEVLEALERADYDVVLMDCQMPELDGFATTRRIRNSGRYGRVRVVAMTANAMEGDRERCLDAGMDEYLSKPVRPDDLKGVLVRAAQAAITALS